MPTCSAQTSISSYLYRNVNISFQTQSVVVVIQTVADLLLVCVQTCTMYHETKRNSKIYNYVKKNIYNSWFIVFNNQDKFVQVVQETAIYTFKMVLHN